MQKTAVFSTAMPFFTVLSIHSQKLVLSGSMNFTLFLYLAKHASFSRAQARFICPSSLCHNSSKALDTLQPQ